ncbi:SDR family NAD(P)-dependent oxidoreductase, partial [Candidatus Woesearchaeota archaeon]|nr:SDR family NAD(P)-dependent oxidoreductase [Candidatus Woesearchaeota archaeon]
MQNKSVLITGASSGIGYAFAEIFAKNSYNLILVARREKELLDLKKKCEQSQVIVKIIVKDLAQPNASQELYDQLKKEKIQTDILINNAGFGEYGSFYNTSWEKEAVMIQLNIVELTHLAKLFGQEMVQ